MRWNHRLGIGPKRAPGTPKLVWSPRTWLLFSVALFTNGFTTIVATQIHVEAWPPGSIHPFTDGPYAGFEIALFIVGLVSVVALFLFATYEVYEGTS